MPVPEYFGSPRYDPGKASWHRAAGHFGFEICRNTLRGHPEQQGVAGDDALEYGSESSI